MSRRPGRPPLDPADPSVKVCVSLPGKRYDALWRAAAEQRTTVAALIRKSLRRDELQNLKSGNRPSGG